MEERVVVVEGEVDARREGRLVEGEGGTAVAVLRAGVEIMAELGFRPVVFLFWLWVRV